jgi:hypothetical protein
MLLAKSSALFQLCWAILAFTGMGLGISVSVVPWTWFLRNQPRFTSEELSAEQPGMAWVTKKPWLGPLVFAGLTLLFNLGQGTQLHGPSLVFPFFFMLSYPIGAYSYVGILELTFGISPWFPWGRHHDRTILYVVGWRVRWVGLYRLILAAIVFTSFHCLIAWEKARS